MPLVTVWFTRMNTTTAFAQKIIITGSRRLKEAVSDMGFPLPGNRQVGGVMG